jgi:hypothetical protein
MAWQKAGNTNQIVHDGLSVDPACTRTSRTAHHYDGTGMSVGIAPGELAESQSFSFTMYIGARETTAQAEAVILGLPGIKFWATAWAGSAADNGSPATFFYAFDIPTGMPLRNSAMALVRACLIRWQCEKQNWLTGQESHRLLAWHHVHQ